MSISCTTNYHRNFRLKQYPFIISQLCRSEAQVGSAGFITEIKMLARLGSYLEVLENNLLSESFRLLAEFSALVF